MASPSEELQTSMSLLDLNPLSLEGSDDSERSQLQDGNDSKLLDLPLELIWEVMSHLSEVDMILLSQTCSAMRYNVPSFRPLKDAWLLPKNDQLCFLEAISANSPDQFACHFCCRLHDVDQRDMPSAPYLTQSSGIFSFTQWLTPVCIEPKEYYLTRFHVRQALKYWRLGYVQHEHYQKLMKPISKSCHHSPPEEMTIRPRIIEGRFLLHVRRVVHITDEGPYSCFLSGGRRACRHHYLWDIVEPFLIRLKHWVPDSGISQRFSCWLCMTEWKIEVDPLHRGIVFDVWRDFGTQTMLESDSCDHVHESLFQLLRSITKPIVLGSIQNRYESAR